MNNCLVNLSGKAGGFLALDALNEHIVREVKGFLTGNQTKSTIDHVRLVKSPLIMILSEIRKVVNGETDSWCFDFHSTSANAWPDVEAVANRLWLEGHTKTDREREKNRGEPVEDLFVRGCESLAMTSGISALIENYTEGDEFDKEVDEGGMDEGEVDGADKDRDEGQLSDIDSDTELILEPLGDAVVHQLELATETAAL
jgi:hypothetical protein